MSRRMSRRSVVASALVVPIAGFGLKGVLAQQESKANAEKDPAASASPSPMASPGASPSASPMASPAAGSAIKIMNFAFSPDSQQVAAGTTVTWTNDDSTAHTVTADDGSFDSGNLDPGKKFSFTFKTAGSYAYHCAIHPSMTATIVVK